MRILFFSNDFPNSLQPTRAVFNQQLMAALTLRHEVRVVSHVSWVDEWKGRMSGSSLQRHITDGRVVSVHPRYYYPPFVLRRLYGAFLWCSVASAVRSTLAHFSPDVVLSYWLHPDGEVALRIGALAGVPTVVMTGGSDVMLLAHHASRRHKIQRVLSRADAVVCVSESLRRAVEALGIERSKVHVVYRGVDRERFAPGTRHQARKRLGLPVEGRMLLWVGRMHAVKGLSVLIAAFVRCCRDDRTTRLYLLGDGPERSRVESLIRESGVGDRVVLPGRQAHERLPDWYRAADASVLPSLSEGIPNVLLESICCGTPFVASDVGGIPEIAQPGLDVLVPPGDADALYHALRNRIRMGGQSERRFQPWTWAKSALALEQVFTGLVCRHTACAAFGAGR